MKYLVLLTTLFLTACGAGQQPVAVENSAPVNAVSPAPTPKNLTLSGVTVNDFEKALPKRVREALENADEIEILTYDENRKDQPALEKFLIGSFEITGNKRTKVAKNDDRRALLDAVYEDVKTGGAMAACFTPHHTIKVEYGGEKIAIAICFHCSIFVGVASNRRFGQTLDGEKNDKGLKEEHFSGSFAGPDASRSLAVFDRLTGTKNL